MKQQAIQYLALDVHQATVLASLRNEHGKVLMRSTVATEGKAILALIAAGGPRVHVAFEEGNAGAVAARSAGRPCGACDRLQQPRPERD
jgi:hypothetical protein